MMAVKTIALAGTAAAALGLGLAACGSSTPSAQTMAKSIVGDTVKSGSEQGYYVKSSYPTSTVTTDSAGDASVHVEMDLAQHANAFGQEAASVGWYQGTVTMFANGPSTFVIHGQG
jgi:hypothetical protein